MRSPLAPPPVAAPASSELDEGLEGVSSMEKQKRPPEVDVGRDGPSSGSSSASREVGNS